MRALKGLSKRESMRVSWPGLAHSALCLVGGTVPSGCPESWGNVNRRNVAPKHLLNVI